MKTPMISEMTHAEKRFWDEHGYLVRRDLFNEEIVAAMTDAVSRIEAWPEVAGKWMRYTEGGQGNKRLCRVENFLPFETVLADILASDGIRHMMDTLFGEQSVIFKDKINFKLPGGNGFAAHQDAPAFVSFGQRFHITLLLAIDQADETNGCLEIAETPRVGEILPQNPDGTLTDMVDSTFRWRPVRTNPGDLVVFDSLVPHRSGPNLSARRRRSLYITYNPLADGDLRAEYFALKREKFPPESERIAGVDYSEGARIFNLANPIQ